MSVNASQRLFSACEGLYACLVSQRAQSSDFPKDAEHISVKNSNTIRKSQQNIASTSTMSRAGGSEVLGRRMSDCLTGLRTTSFSD